MISKTAFDKCKREMLVFAVVFSAVFALFIFSLYSPIIVRGASFYFTQTEWSQKNNDIARHDANSGPPASWSNYSDADSSILVDASLQLTTSDLTKIFTSNADFSNYSNLNNTQVAGSGDLSSIMLTPLNEAKSDLVDVSDVRPVKILMGSDGLQRIITTSGNNILYIRCLVKNCSQKTSQPIFSNSYVASSFALDNDNVAQIVYLDPEGMKLVRCQTQDCSSFSPVVLLVSKNSVSYPLDISMSIDQNDNQLKASILYSFNNQLIFLRCDNENCSSAQSNIISSIFNPGYASTPSAKFILGSDGNPRIVFIGTGSSPWPVYFVRCQEAACAPSNMILNQVTSTSFSDGAYSSAPIGLAIGADNTAAIVYRGSDSKTTFLKCGDEDCSPSGNNTVVNLSGVGESYNYPAFAVDINSQGLASVAYLYYSSSDRFEGYEPDVMLVRCADLTCTNSQNQADQIIQFDTPWTSERIVLDVGKDDFAHLAYYGNNGNLGLYYSSYSFSGTYLSGAVDMGSKILNWNNISWTNGGNAGLTNITLKIRSSDTENFSKPYCEFSSSPGSFIGANCVSSSDRYIQYEATLTSSELSETPYLDSITIGYTGYPSSASLTSSVYDSASAGNLVAKVNWQADNLSLTEGINVQIRTSPDNSDWSQWCGFDDIVVCAGNNYINDSQNNVILPSVNPVSSGEDDQYFQYRVILYSGGSASPILNDITIVYVVNASPEVDTTYGINGLLISQITDSADARWGKLSIKYRARDVDTSSGTVTPGKVNVGLEYSLDGGNNWQAIDATSSIESYAGCDIVALCPISETNFADYEVFWDASAQIDNYSANAKIRLTLDDNEVANNQWIAISTVFVLDVKKPVLSSYKIDSSQSNNKISFSASDDTNIDYRMSNNSDFSNDGLNALSGVWQTVGAKTINTSTAWILTGADNYESVYVQIRDQFNNISSATLTAPYAPRNTEIKDVSSVADNNYRLFIIWDVYESTSTAQFARYEIYRSVGSDSNFALYKTITNSELNYFSDVGLSAATDYYYRVFVVDIDGDISDISSVNDIPDGYGEGGGVDEPLAIISTPYAKEVKAFSAKIVWSTNERSNSKVYYSEAPSKSFSRTAVNSALMADHEVTITDIKSSTQYYFKVESEDINNIKVSDDNNGNGYSFTTQSGPSISGVTTESVTNNTATIFWNTNIDTNSYVIYSANLGNLMSGVNVSEVGDANLVGGTPYQHRVKISGLTEQTIYYFYVKSTDSENNSSIDNNSGAYYSFTTTNDTKPPEISNIIALTVLSQAAVISWETDELANSQIEFGETKGYYPSFTSLDSVLTISHVGVLSGLSSKTTYYYRVKSTDSHGNTNESAEQIVETTGADEAIVVVTKEISRVMRETTPPVISNVETKKLGAFETTISFETDEPAIGFILYGKTSQYKRAEASTGFSQEHEITMSGLTPGTDYHFQVKAQDQYGNSSYEQDRTFTTKFAAEVWEESIELKDIVQFQENLEGLLESVAPSLVAPLVYDVKLIVEENSAVIAWKTNVKSSSLVALAQKDEYKSGVANPYSVEVGNTDERVKDHRVEIANLLPNTHYYYMAKSFNLPYVVGKSANLSFITKGVKVQAQIVDLGNNIFKIMWSSSEPTTSVVEYENPATGEIIKKTSSAYKIFHEMIISALMPATTYKIKAYGYGESGNLIEVQKALTITTVLDAEAPIVSGLKVDSALVPGRNDRIQSVISWRTNEPAMSVVYYKQGVFASDEDFSGKIENLDSAVSSHVVVLGNLKPATVYQIKIVIKDLAGNEITTQPRIIITPRQAESIFDIIFKNFEDTFKFLKKL